MAANPRDLLGGYASSSLVPDERRQLMEAALEDQELFDDLVAEEALREALDDPATRATLLDVLREEPARAWWRALQLRVVFAAAAVLVAAGAGVIVYRTMQAPADRTVARAPEGVRQAPADDTPVEPAPEAAETTLAAWLPGAPASESESAFRPALGDTGVLTKGAPLPRHEFVSDRDGVAAVFRIVNGSPAVRIGAWQQVRAGEALALPSLPDDAEIRVVVVDAGVDTSDDADVMRALESGRGGVHAFRPRLDSPPRP